jgi:hypothetical protein
MKQTLTLITFLLLLLPVWKDCTVQKPVTEANDIAIIDTLDVSRNEIDTTSINERNRNTIDPSPQKSFFGDFLKIFEWDDCESGYRQVWLAIEYFKMEKDETGNVENEDETINTDDEKTTIIKEIFDFLLFVTMVFSFSIYFLISIALTIFSFTKKRKTFIWLSGIALLVISWSYSSNLYYATNYYQIKFGFYLLIINSLLIFLSSFLWNKKGKIQSHSSQAVF